MRHIELDANEARNAAASITAAGADAFVCLNELFFWGARAGARRMLGAKAHDIGYSVRTCTNFAEYIDTTVYASHYSRLETGLMLADLLLKRLDGAPLESCQRIEEAELRIYNRA